MSDAIERARRIDLLFNDDDVQAALSDLKTYNYKLFLAAGDDAGRAMAQAQALVLESFEATLRGLLDAGELAKHEQDRRDRAPVIR